MSELWLRLRGTFWAVPMLCTAVAVLLGLVLTSLDEQLDTSLTCPSCSPVALRGPGRCCRRSSPR